MRKINIRKRAIGVSFDESGRADVLLWAPGVDRAGLLIPEKNVSIPMACEDYGYWSLQTTELAPGDLYLFNLDGHKQLPDPASVSQPHDVDGPSQALNMPSFNWTDQKWENLPLQKYIIYEIHVGTFTPEGTFAALEERLDYLLELGITAIEIMPVAQFAGKRNWGYDGVYPFCVQGSYGGAQGLQSLVNTCHRKGLAVILDVVYNHVGPQGNHLADFGPYFTEKYHTPWGNAINFDDAWCDSVRQFYIENALMWFRDFHIDALRMDAVHAIKDFSPVHILQDIRQHVDALRQYTARRNYLIVELDLNDTRYINPVSKSGFGMDAQWIDEFHHALRVAAGQQRTGYYTDFNGVESLAKAFEDAYVYDGTFSRHRKKTFGMKATENPAEQFIVFSQNHDHVGNRMLGERTSQLVSFEMQKLLAGAVMASPYIPLLFMGEEYSETNPFLYFVSHSDPKLAEAVRKGRKKEFEAFHTGGEMPDPLSEQTFNNSKLRWETIGQQPHITMLRYYKQIIAIRKAQPPLYVLDRKEVSVDYDTLTETVLLHRRHNLQNIICLMNFSKKTQTIQIPAYSSRWLKLLASSDTQWGGTQDMPGLASGQLPVGLPPESFSIYTSE